MYLISVNIIIWYFLYIFWNGVVFFSPSEVCTEHYCQHSHQEKYDQNWFIISKTYTWDTAAFGRLYLNTGIGHKPWFKFPGNRSIKALKKKKALLNDYFIAWREMYWKLICSISQSWLIAEISSLYPKVEISK